MARPNLTTGATPKDLPRFMSKISVDPATGCWNWTAGKFRNGYGQFHVAKLPRKAHRVAYELLVGPIPEGMIMDHLCKNTSCCNPEHLEPVDERMNTLRGNSIQGRNAAKIACKAGHVFTPENTYTNPSGYRQCRTCNNERQRQWSARKRQAKSQGTASLE